MKTIEISNEFKQLPYRYANIVKAMLDNDKFLKDDVIEAKVAYTQKDIDQKDDRLIFVTFPLGQFASPHDFQANILDMNLNLFGLEIYLRLRSSNPNKKVNLFYY